MGVVLVVAGLGILGLSRLANPSGEGGVGGASTKAGRWAPMSASPLDRRISAATEWTGTEMLVWGGRDCAAGRCDDPMVAPFSDGAAYNPTTDTWRRMSASPLSARSGVAGAWTGRELLLWGGTDGQDRLSDGAAYDPASDTWRPLPPASISGRTAGGTWTGEEMLVWGGTAMGSSGVVEPLTDGAAYDPASDTWRPLAPAPLAAREDVTSEWTGREMIVWGGRAGQEYLADGAAYDPAADTWRPLAPAPLEGRVVRGVWSGTELLVWGGESATVALADGAAYDPAADTWRPMAPAPLSARRGFATVWAGEEMLVWGGAGGTGSFFFGNGAGYDPRTNSWKELAPSFGRFIPTAHWTGREMLVWGGIVADDAAPGARGGISASADGARYVP
ncbi:MAG: Kelch repeat-containing protein [Acidimicrobiales bacterium]